ncbi:peptidoglycan-binding protein [Streptomyces umbrinus]|uniref:peptidoglycan-binding protein n=1 Tax=Streptomyces umbrinus TaxID=67370 RepID=UPI003C3075A6
MKLVTRAALGWPTSAAPRQASAKGVKVHYEGTTVSTALLTDHNACLTLWKAIRKAHLANTRENYSDVAYNYAACPHGYLLEGRGIGRRTGANGNAALNVGHYAILGLVGSKGLTEPNAAMLGAIRDGIDLLRANGAGAEVKGHRDGYATACPGGPLYAWVQKGAPRPVVETKPGATTPPPKFEPFPGGAFFLSGGQPALGKRSAVFTEMGKRLVAVGCGRYEVGPGPVLELADVASYEAWQRKCGHSGTAAKWPPGKSTWDALKVPNV